MTPSTAGASPPPLRPLRSLLAGLAPATYVAPLSPRAGPHFFSGTCIVCMADMSASLLSTELIEFILPLSLRRAPYPPPSDPVSRHRTEIVSSSLDQGSWQSGISSSLALCPTFDLASAQSSSPVFGQGFFLPRRRLRPLSNDNLSLFRMHGSHVDPCIADQTVKTYIGFVAGDAAPYPPPSDPRLATPDRSRILLPRLGSTWSGAYPPPLRKTITQIWLRPYHKAPTSVGASFFARIPSSANLHGSTSD